MQRLERSPRSSLPQHLVHLLEQARRTALGDLPAQRSNRLERIAVDREAQPRCQRDRPEHAHRVLLESHHRVPDGANQLPLHVLEPAAVVDHRERGDVVEQRVDGEVAPERVLFGRAEGVVAPDQTVVVRGRRLLAEGRDLDHLAPEAKRDTGGKPTTDDEAVAEEPLDGMRMRRGADVEVLGRPLEQQVAHAATHQVRGVPVVLQSIEDLERIRIDVLARDVVLRARKYAGGRHS